MDTYDAAHIASFFDAYGEREWNRFDLEPLERVNLHIHQHYLGRFVEPHMHVLDAGAGPGRFTIDVAQLGAKVTALDLSAGQLAQHRQRLGEAGLEHAVVARVQGDVTDLSRFNDASFDLTVCYGGPVSYAMDRADDAVRELLRVTKPGGYVLLSVMSKVGATRIFLPGVLALYAQHPELVENVLKTGVLPKSLNDGHAMKMYSWADLEALLARHPCEVVSASAANHLSTTHPEAVSAASADPEMWGRLLEWELELCAEPGNLDGGTHILSVLRRR